MNDTRTSARQLAAMIDHAVLRPDASQDDLRTASELVTKHRVGCLCVRGCDVAAAKRLLAGSGVRLGTVIAFPHGTSSPAAKVAEAQRAVGDGADELDMVLNIGRLRDGDTAYVQDEIAAVVAAAPGRCVKVILECGYLDEQQMAKACRAAVAAGARFVKTSTGFGPRGATVEDVRLLRRHVGSDCGVKAAGGIRTLDDALAMIAAGADRIGTSSTEAILGAAKRRISS